MKWVIQGRRRRMPFIVGGNMLAVTAIAAALVVSSAAADSRLSSSPRSGHARDDYAAVASATRSLRPGKADWKKIKIAARLRRMGLAPDRTAHFRAFAGYLGLSELATVHPLAPGRCRVAVTYLDVNLRDLADARPGEKWAPLRRLVAREPSIYACAPRRAKQRGSSPTQLAAASSTV